MSLRYGADFRRSRLVSTGGWGLFAGHQHGSGGDAGGVLAQVCGQRGLRDPVLRTQTGAGAEHQEEHSLCAPLPVQLPR